jgi:membrane protein required for colicin V production
MNSLDVIVVTIITITTVFGLWKGLVKQLFALGGVIAGYICAIKFYEQSAVFLPKMDTGMAKIVSFIGIFVAIIITALILSWIIERTVKTIKLGWVNRICGGVLGFLKGFLVVTVIAMVLLTFLPEDNSILKYSITLPYTLYGIEFIDKAVPQDIKLIYRQKISQKQYLRFREEKK